MVRFWLNAKNPLLDSAGAINADIKVQLRKRGDQVDAEVSGSHDGFPAYELYINGQNVYRHDPLARVQSPFSLYGTGSGEWAIQQPPLLLKP